jgi:hypothetical protein
MWPCGEPSTGISSRMARAGSLSGKVKLSKRRGSRYVAGRTEHWLKVKNPDAPAVRREFAADWSR